VCSRPLADSRIEPLKACDWALGRGLLYAIATAVVAIVIASFVSGADAERFATTAYLAALVVALLVAIRWFFRDVPENGVRREPGPPFPAALAFASSLGALLLIGAGFAAEPGSELIAIGACFGLIVVAALARGGAFAAVNAWLRRGDRLSAATRYAVAAAVVALAARALFSAHAGDGFAKLAYAAAVVAALAVAASLAAPTAAGAAVRRQAAGLAAALRGPESPRVFAQTTQYAAATLTAGLILASLLPGAYAERFTTVAYVAMLFLALAVGMSWRLRNGAHAGSGDGATIAWPRFTLVVGALLVAGAGLAFNPIAEALVVCACLYVIVAAILKGSRPSNAAA